MSESKAGESITYTYDRFSNRAGMTVSGSDGYTTTYAYDANNRLVSEVKDDVTTTYTYDNNGNTIGKATGARLDVYSYNLYNQLTGNIIGGVNASYTYNAKGIRTSKTVGTDVTSFILDGGNVIAEVKGTEVVDYIRGINLICTDTEYYIYNAHGDVVSLTSTAGMVTKTYDYDAFGNEANPSEADTNPFRYCGEYYDTETGTYYLRARYYDPTIGRFTAEDTHWNTSNMIYGDNPQKIGKHIYAPNIYAISQDSNRYVYCINNPVVLVDSTGKNVEALHWIPALADAIPVVIGCITTAVATIKAAIATSWFVPLAIASATAAVVTIGYVVYKAVTYMVEALQAMQWVDSVIAEGGVEDLRGTTVYVMQKKEDQKAWYVGITNNYDRRKYEHQKKTTGKYPEKDYNMIPVATSLTRQEARAMEQSLISAYTMEALDNQMNSIAKARWGEFVEEFKRAENLMSGLITD